MTRTLVGGRAIVRATIASAVLALVLAVAATAHADTSDGAVFWGYDEVGYARWIDDGDDFWVCDRNNEDRWTVTAVIEEHPNGSNDPYKQEDGNDSGCDRLFLPSLLEGQVMVLAVCKSEVGGWMSNVCPTWQIRE